MRKRFWFDEENDLMRTQYYVKKRAEVKRGASRRAVWKNVYKNESQGSSTCLQTYRAFSRTLKTSFSRSCLKTI